MKEQEDLSLLEVPELQAEWKKAPTLNDLKGDLTESLSDHSAVVTTIKHWIKVLENPKEKADEGAKKKTTKLKSRSTYTAKLVRKQCEWRYPALSEPFLSTPDLFKIDPMTHLDVLSAKQNELLINHQFNTCINRVNFFDTYVRNAVNWGTVIVKVTWKEETAIIKQKVPVVSFIVAETPEQEAEVVQWIDMFEQEPDKFEQLVPEEWEEAINLTMERGEPIYPVIEGEEEQEIETVVKNHPELVNCNFEHVIIDPTCKGKFEDAKFVIHMFETCLGDLAADGRYTNLEFIDLQSASPLAATDATFNAATIAFKFKDKARQKVIAYEYWGYRDIDGSGKLTPIVATWVGNTLIQLERSPYQDGSLPFVVVPYMPVYDSVYGEADAELLEDNQNIIGAVSRGVIDLMGKSANAQTGYSKGALDVTNKNKFEAGEDFEFNPNTDPTTAFFQFKFPEIPQSAEYMIQSHTAEAEALTGVKSFTGGITGASVGNTATGVRSAMDATAKRDSDILRRLGEGLIKIGRKIMAMNAMFLDKEEVVRITDTEFVPIRKDDLQGKFDLRLTISTAESDNQKAEELSFMLQTTASYIGFDMTRLILANIARLRKMPELAHKIETFSPQPDPLAQKKAELEIQLLEAQIQNELASAQAKAATAANAPVVAETELAKQRKLASEADLNDLNFIEQERGVKQERDLQKSQAQAMGNIQLQKAKAILNQKGKTDGQ